MRELSERYQIDQEGKLDIVIVKISEEYWLFNNEDKLEVLNLMQSWINKQRDAMQ